MSSSIGTLLLLRKLSSTSSSLSTIFRKNNFQNLRFLSSSSSTSTLVEPAKPGKAQYNFQSKVALVTASTEGIGFAIAKRLAESGAQVIISSRKQSNVDLALKQLHDQGLNSVSGLVCHVGKEKDRKNLLEFVLEKHKGLDILVSNAAVNPAVGHILDMGEKEFDKIFEINVKAAFMLSKEFVPHMEERPGDKSIIFISSYVGYQIMPIISAYSVSKTALIGLSRAIAMHCSEKNIRVNCVCPGVIRTKFSDQLADFDGFEEELEKMLLIKRLGEPSEVANLVAFLVSEEASYITGESFVPAGGIYSRL